MVVLLVSPQADFFSKIHGLKIHGGSAGYPCGYACPGGCVRACVGIPVGAYVCAYVRAYVARPIQAKKPYDPQKRPKFGLIRPYWYKTTQTNYKRK